MKEGRNCKVKAFDPQSAETKAFSTGSIRFCRPGYFRSIIPQIWTIRRTGSTMRGHLLKISMVIE